MAATHTRMSLWDDNPSLVDLLGFDAVVTPVLEAMSMPDLDPLTIGIQSPWGGGKSTVLGLLEEALKGTGRYVVITTDPWQYDDHDDVRGTLIADVLDVLRTKFDSTADISKRIKELLQRISWSRATVAIGKGALTMQWSPKELVEAFTPRKRSSPQTMSGFKDAFGELIQELPDVDRVIVLVDDLDRCLPNAVMATLESIKLFLAVPKMVFVLAADQDMVRDAIAASLDASNRSERFASRYLEKIVQLPISLPRLTQHEAETYIALLMAHRASPFKGAFDDLVRHAADRRRANKHPILGDFNKLTWHPDDALMRLAAQLAQGLSADRLANPRQIKRFLNAYGVRSSIARAREVDIEASVLVKMLLLEDQHRSSFETLAATNRAARTTLLQSWESWAAGETATRPGGISEDTREWAATEPRISDANLGPYLDLAATLLNVRVGEQASEDVLRLVQDLLGEGDAARDAALLQVAALAPSEQEDALSVLMASGRNLDDASNLFTSAIAIAKANPDLASQVVRGIRNNWSRLTPGAVVDLQVSGIPALTELVVEIRRDETLPAMVQQAAAIEEGP